MVLKSLAVAILWLLAAPGIYGQAKTDEHKPIAMVGGKPLFDEDLLPLIQSQLLQLRSQEYDLRSKFLDSLINQKLAEAEAQQRNLTAQQLLDLEINSKVVEPTDAEIKAFYEAQKSRINGSFEQVKAQVWQALKQARVQQASEVYFTALRNKAGVEVLLEAPRVRIDFDAKRVRGNPDAPVTIVEFADFQCPFCRSAHATIQAILTEYGSKVNFAFLDFPLNEIHPQAQSAAEAARCAGDQGKFWEYHDLLYTNQSNLNGQNLADYARTLRMDSKAFSACMSSGQFKNEIERDAQTAKVIGISGTPAFFINGIFVNGAQPAQAFERVINNELALIGRNSTRVQ